MGVSSIYSCGADCYEHGKELVGCIEGCEVVQCLSYCQVFEKKSVSYN